MRTVAGAFIAVGFVVAFVVGVIHVAVPPNESAEEGSADRFLFVRRPVIKALHAVGFLDQRSARSCLPSVSDQTTTEGLPTGEELPVCELEVNREPVYRGLLWKVGRRITYRLRYFREWRENWRAVRLCYAVSGRRFVAAENTTLEPGGQLAEVSGFVPSSARGFWVEYTDDKGEVHGLNGWGDIDPFWPD